MKGFYLYAGYKDVFIETTYTRKTKELARKIIRAMNGNGGFDIPDNAAGIDSVLWYLRRAECDIHTLSNGSQYYEIHGDNFGGMGSFVGDGKTVILHLGR